MPSNQNWNFYLWYRNYYSSTLILTGVFLLLERRMSVGTLMSKEDLVWLSLKSFIKRDHVHYKKKIRKNNNYLRLKQFG